MTLCELDLSVRAYNCLTRGGLVDQSPTDKILDLTSPSTILNLGRKTYVEIVYLLAKEYTPDRIKQSRFWQTAPQSWKLDPTGQSIL
jgi:DNA-directed RNA polymerase alpha subunit